MSSNWLQSTVDPAVRFAPRAVVTFDILRNGAIANVQMLQSSGNASVDSSAVRAVQGSNPLQPLPGDYSGNKVRWSFGSISSGRKARPAVESDFALSTEKAQRRHREKTLRTEKENDT